MESEEWYNHQSGSDTSMASYSNEPQPWLNSDATYSSPEPSYQDTYQGQDTTSDAYASGEAYSADTYSQSQYQDSEAYGEESSSYASTPVSSSKKMRPSARAKREGASSGKSFVYGLVGGLVACAVGLGGYTLVSNVLAPAPEPEPILAEVETEDTQASVPIIQEATPTEDETLAEKVSSKCLPSVMSLIVQSDTAVSAGSGVILDNNGHLLTNYHVVEGANTISANQNGTSYSATVLGSDPSSDLAVVQVDFHNDPVQPMEVADSDELKIGQWVMAIGSPFGLDQSVSTGIVSSLYRSTILPSTLGQNIYTNLIQTDAAINPGNSGGALVNADGKLVGINSIISSTSGSSSGVGFAIPANYAVGIANTIIAGDPVEHAYLGATIRTVTAEVAMANNLPVSSGAYVVSVQEGSPAAAIGLQEGDIITNLADTPVTSADGLILAVRSQSVGASVPITFWRGSEADTVDVTLGSDANGANTDATEGENSGGVIPGQQMAPNGDNGFELELIPGL